MYVSYMLSYLISGFEPWGYHLVNIILHGMNATALFLIVSTLLRKIQGSAAIDGAFSWLPLTSSLLFAANPINTEVVAWAAGAPELYFTLFIFIAFFMYMKDRIWISLIFFFIAILSKETGFTLFFFMLFYDILLRREPFAPLFGHIKRYLPFLGPTTLYFGLRSVALGNDAASFVMQIPNKLSTYEMFINIPVLFGKCVGKLAAPVNLSFFSYMSFDPARSIIEPAAIVFLIFLVVFILVIKRLAIRAPIFSFSLLWILFPLFPLFFMSWTTGYPIYENRYLYLPSAGFSIFIALCALKATALFKAYRISAPATAIIILAVISLYGIGVVKRSVIWRKNITLWEDTVSKDPGNKIARYNLANTLAKLNMPDRAIIEYKETIKIDPKHVESHNNLATIYAKSGDLDNAIQYFKNANFLAPDNKGIERNLGRALRLRKEPGN